MSHASDICVSLSTAIRADLAFVAAQHASPDALTQAQVAARRDVIELTRQRQSEAHCPADR